MLAETLRLDLRPFSVDVMEIVTGAVWSNGQTDFGDWALPAGSLYKAIEPVVKQRVQGCDGLPHMNTAEYAAVVDKILSKRNRGRFWYGVMTDVVKGMPVPAGHDQDAMVSFTLSAYAINSFRILFCLLYGNNYRTLMLLWGLAWILWERIGNLRYGEDKAERGVSGNILISRY